ncbi:TetR/AcrR family transcriptional regulator [Nocardia sp. NPDC019255]|uniref:TetR/AcrR family transcriptional regulator n=1 Tax=Nocardia sp. NPDC019255 TaxID=3154591 RepID=UPI0033E4ECFB
MDVSVAGGGGARERAFDPKRPKRMSAEYARRAMLETAVELVNEHGLTVSLQHISLDHISAVAGVARSAVYRIWPTREDFFDELLVKVASKPEYTPSVHDPETLITAMRTLKSALQATPDLLATAEMRYAILVEMCRTGAKINYDNVTLRRNWRTYIALSATALSYAEPLRQKLQEAIAQNEASYIAGMAGFYVRVGNIIGRRVRPEFDATSEGKEAFANVAATGSALMEGMVLRNITTPEGKNMVPDLTDDGSRTSDPFGTGNPQPWTAPAIAFAGMFLAMTEPIPDAEYDRTDLDRRLDEVEQYIAGLPDTTLK